MGPYLYGPDHFFSPKDADCFLFKDEHFGFKKLCNTNWIFWPSKYFGHVGVKRAFTTWGNVGIIEQKPWKLKIENIDFLLHDSIERIVLWVCCTVGVNGFASKQNKSVPRYLMVFFCKWNMGHNMPNVYWSCIDRRESMIYWQLFFLLWIGFVHFSGYVIST